MLIDVELLDILKRADLGCPKCQYVMAIYYSNGKGVPKDKHKAKHYFKLTAANDPEELSFIGECYSMLLLNIAYREFVDEQDQEALKYFNLAKDYIRNNYPPDEAEKMILNSKADKYLSVIDV